MTTRKPLNKKDGSGHGQQGGRNTNKGGCSKGGQGRGTGKGQGKGTGRKK